MPELDWNLIRSFVAVAETGSLSAAARKLGSSQPTLGRHIAELEHVLDVTLFRRGRQGYVLTEAVPSANRQHHSRGSLWARWKRSKARSGSRRARWSPHMSCL
jgi:hypothetical protein